LGGLLTRYVAPPVALAQDQAPIVKEIRAQSFTLVDPSDHAVGTFTVEPLAGSPGTEQFYRLKQYPNNQFRPERPLPMRIVLRDSAGRELWSAGGSMVRPLSVR